MTNSNPYQSPRADLAPVDWASRREQRSGSVLDSLLLWVSGAILCCLLIFGIAAALTLLALLGWITL